MKDKIFLEWLFTRLVEVYKENEYVDYMLKLKSIINMYDADKITPNTSGSLQQVISRQHTKLFEDWLKKYFVYDPVIYEYKEKYNGKRHRLSTLYKNFERAYHESPLSD